MTWPASIALYIRLGTIKTGLAVDFNLGYRGSVRGEVRALAVGDGGSDLIRAGLEASTATPGIRAPERTKRIAPGAGSRAGLRREGGDGRHSETASLDRRRNPDRA